MTNYIAALVDELYQLGVHEVVISPGSRSTPLSMLFCEHDYKTYVNIDERSAAFFALGIAKEHKRPVVLVCTSGTAVANYFPAVIEAKQSRIPLIILSADRPKELSQVGAPQSIDQNKIFGNYVNYYEDLALPEENEAMYRYVRVVMQKAYSSSISDKHGVSHINVPIREPLIPNFEELDFSSGRQINKFKYTKGSKSIAFDESDFKNKNGIIICGEDQYSNYHNEIVSLANKLKAPILADPLSNIRNLKSEFIIDSYDAFLKNDDVKVALKPDYIIHFGAVPVSKRLQQYLKMYNDSIYYVVNEGFDYRNPSLSTTNYIEIHPINFVNSITIVNIDSNYLNKWLKYQRDMRKKLNSVINEESFFEGKIIKILQDELPEDSRLVISNSMAIRDIDYFFESCNQKIKILCNRGSNGIDGIVSTALGISTCDLPTILLTGDLSFYHDLNGLLIGKKHNLNLIIILLNNNGGGIFRYLPQSKQKNFEYLFLTPHNIKFEGLRELYDLNYNKIYNYMNFEKAFNKALEYKGISVVEAVIDSELSKKLHDIYTDL